MRCWAVGGLLAAATAALLVPSPARASFPCGAATTTTTSTTDPSTTTTVESTTTTTDPSTTTTTIPSCDPTLAGVSLQSWPALVTPASFPALTSFTVTANVAVISGGVTLHDLTQVRMCWFKMSAVQAQLGSNDCSTLDPRYNFEMVWKESGETVEGTDGFSVSPNPPPGTQPQNQYRDMGSHVETSVGTPSFDSAARSMTINFVFGVSTGMAAGSDWSVTVDAVYDNESSVGTSTQSSIEVGYWRAVTLINEGQHDFSRVPAGASASWIDGVRATYQANAPSVVEFSASDFCVEGKCGVSELRLSTQAPPASVAPGSVTLSCRPTGGTLVLLSSEAQSIIALDPTGETAQDMPPVTCTLSYGGGATYALRPYSNTVTVEVRRS